MEVLHFIIRDYAYPIGPYLIKNYKFRNVVKVDKNKFDCKKSKLINKYLWILV